jgi:GNAT superfamily N-acetyltransferase
MVITLKGSCPASVRELESADYHQLSTYLQRLSEQSTSRFGPHGFDYQSIAGFYGSCDEYKGYIIEINETQTIIAYAIVKIGYLHHDKSRLNSYGIIPDEHTDCAFAPSVADEWQGCGVGSVLFGFVKNRLLELGVQRIILWGGVQCSNVDAVRFYLRHGFKPIGRFEYHGWNEDMILFLNEDSPQNLG